MSAFFIELEHFEIQQILPSTCQPFHSSKPRARDNLDGDPLPLEELPVAEHILEHIGDDQQVEREQLVGCLGYSMKLPFRRLTDVERDSPGREVIRDADEIEQALATADQAGANVPQPLSECFQAVTADARGD